MDQKYNDIIHYTQKHTSTSITPVVQGLGRRTSIANGGPLKRGKKKGIADSHFVSVKHLDNTPGYRKHNKA